VTSLGSRPRRPQRSGTIARLAARPLVPAPALRVLWDDRLDRGAELCTVTPGVDGVVLEGRVLTALDGRPTDVAYRIEADAAWRTRTVSVVVDGERRMAAEADGAGAWTVDGRREATLDGCLDVDLEVTPATNTLAIRRLALRPGDGADIEAAWLRFPALRFERSTQRYERVARDRYRYSAGAFTAVLRVDDLGVVADYEGIWEAVAAERC
jgi:uncharacterized protein